MREFVTAERFEEIARGSLLVPVALAAAVRGVSRQRLYARIESGSVRVVVACGGFVLVDLSTVPKRSQMLKFAPQTPVGTILRELRTK